MRAGRPGRSPVPPRRFGLLIALLVFAVTAHARAELSESEWQATTRGLARLMKTPGGAAEKSRRAAALGRDDSVRAAVLLTRWAVASERLRQGPLLRALLAREKKRDAYRARMRKRYGGRSDGWKPKEVQKLGKLEAALRSAQTAFAVETEVDRQLARALRGLRAREAWAWVFTEGLAALQKQGYAGALYRAAFEALPTQETPAARAAVLALVRGPAPPATRVLALDWIAAARPAGGFEATLHALGAARVIIRRAALRALRGLDDPRAIGPLVEAIQVADGLLATEIDQLLYWFTGLTLEADAAAWLRWWTTEGPSFQAAKRHAGPAGAARPDDATFYGIRSPSKRILFVLDQSGSMQKPAQGLDAQTGKPRPGGTRMEAALSELRRAIKALAADVQFNVILYSDGPSVWRKPPGLLPATPEHKAAVSRWLDHAEATGTTALFEALQKALDYADGGQDASRPAGAGADTVFLLTDGHPTDSSGDDLSVRARDAALLRFLAANEVARLVVHTIGIGRGHDALLMSRLAEKTGGTYSRP